MSTIIGPNVSFCPGKKKTDRQIDNYNRAIQKAAFIPQRYLLTRLAKSEPAG